MSDRLVTFLYLLARDELLRFSNPHMEAWSRDAADRILGEPRDTRPPPPKA